MRKIANTHFLLPSLLIPLFLLVILRFIIPMPRIFLSLSEVPYHKDNPRYDYAAIDSGGKILDKSSMINNAKGILYSDQDKYMVVPCYIPEKWIEISLNEDINIEEFQIKQGEIYSSSFKEIQLWGSIEYPSHEWMLIGNFILEESKPIQRFKVNPKWVRFLKVYFIDYYGDEYYCSITQFSVYGTNMLRTFNDDFKAKIEETQNNEKIFEHISPYMKTIEKIKKLKEKKNKIIAKSYGDDNFYDWNSSEDYCIYDTNWNFSNKNFDYSLNSSLQNPSNFGLNFITKNMVGVEIRLQELELFKELFAELADENQNAFEKIDKNLDVLKNDYDHIILDLLYEVKDREYFLKLFQFEIEKLRKTIKKIEGKNKEKELSLGSLKFYMIFFFIFNIIIAATFFCKWLSSFRNTNKIKVKEF
ncbi:unnamed protein product [Blepharisma stoltei]|uniref:SUN domain-containing protein n=1 Tax=Blepharisma stoltei TaxID=1481888 RepID=A0AAU9ISJ3_9CILI|nr:unnamed protein product [Blepharisma stoltei]